MTRMAYSAALRIALIYATVAALWILLSDHALEALTTDPDWITRLQTYKGWAFVAATALLLYWLIQRNERELSRLAEEERAAQQLSTHILERISDAFVALDKNWRYTHVSARAGEFFGRKPEELIGKNIWAEFPEGVGQPFYHAYYKAVAEQTPIELEEYYPSRNLWFESRVYPSQDGLSIFFHDISERKRHESELIYLANHNTLTGLPNRNLLTDRLQQALIEAKRHDRMTALIFLDLDRFKHVTESLGHEVGDLVLKRVAEQLDGMVREGDTVAHPGGDEFALLLTEISHSEDAARQVQKVLNHFENSPLTVGEHKLFVTVSAGIALYPTDSENAEGLLQAALAAMYRSQALGGNTYQFYSSEMNAKALENLAMGSALHDAIARNELELHYQPQVDLASGEIIGMEALARWHHPQLGMVSPAVFIPLAEETGLIGPIGTWVLSEACRQNKAWQDEGLPPLRVAVNLSARQFRQRDIAATVAQTLADTGLESHFLELEITESMLMQDVPSTISTMQQLKEIGISFSLDDFGTGYSSLSYLKRFPIETLKIDQSFVRDIPHDKDDSAIAAAIIAMATALGIKVIAEGVETPEQLAFLCAQKCTAMQGYYFSKPLPAEDFALLLRQGKTLQAFPLVSPDFPETT